MAVQTFITNNGADLIAKAVAGAFAISFVGAEIGTGAIGSGEDAKTYTALKVKYADALLSDTTYEGNATCKFSAQYTATGLAEAVLITEIGIYATDPDLGRILFTYTNLGDNPDRLFPSDQASFYKFYDVTITFTVENGVTVSINPSALVPATEVVNTPTANKLLRLDGAGKLPASITGDAGTVGGKQVSELALSSHSHAEATSSTSGFLSGADKSKLDTVSGNVNQDLKTSSTPTFNGLNLTGPINGATFL